MDDEINSKLLEIGSKFNESFSDTPIELLNIVKQQINKKKCIIKNNNRYIIKIEYNKIAYPNGIGTYNITPLNLLNEKELLNITYIITENIKLVKIKKEPTKTWCFYAIFTVENIELKTIFPGEYAPPLPNKNMMTKAEYNNAKTFWERHLITY